MECLLPYLGQEWQDYAFGAQQKQTDVCLRGKGCFLPGLRWQADLQGMLNHDGKEGIFVL